MFKPRTIIILLFSLLMGVLAVKAWSVATRPSPERPAAVEKKEEAKAPDAERPAAPVSFSGSVPKGKRVVSIKVDEVSGATRALTRNDRVDVIAVTDVTGTSGGKIARVVLQNVAVHDVEQSYYKKQITDKATRKKKTWTLQLLVSLSQAVTLASVDEAARLRLVLRNPGDDAVDPPESVFYSPKTGVTPEGAAQGFTGRILPGMRAISLAVDNSDGICGTLRPGDRVDVVVSFKLAGFAAAGGNLAEGNSATVTGNRKSSKIFIQDITVLSTDQDVNEFTGTQDPVTRVGLMVTPKQAEKLAVIADASKASAIRLILRHPGDRSRVTTRGEMFSEQILTEKKAFKVIDTVKGTKVYPRKFYE